MADQARENILQIQKEGEGLAVVVRGNWGSSRARTAHYLAALGEAGIMTACDVQATGQFPRFTVGAYSARIDLDSSTLRKNGFSAVRAMLDAIGTDLKLAGPAADFSRANIYEQVIKAARLQPAEYQAAFSRPAEEIQRAIEDNRSRTDISVLEEQEYESPESAPQFFPRPAPLAPPPVPAGGIDRAAARQKEIDNSVSVTKFDDGTASVLICFPYEDNDDIDTLEKTAKAAHAFREAASGAGMQVGEKLLNGFLQGYPQKVKNGVAVTVQSSKEAFQLAQLVHDQNARISEARLAEVRESVPSRWQRIGKILGL